MVYWCYDVWAQCDIHASESFTSMNLIPVLSEWIVAQGVIHQQNPHCTAEHFLGQGVLIWSPNRQDGHSG